MMKLDQELRQNTVNWLLKKFDGTHYYKQYIWAAKQTLPRENQFAPQTMRKITLDLTLNIVISIF